MRVIDRAARLPIHTFDLAVLALVAGDDGVEILGRELLAGLVLDDRPQHVEQLSLVEAKLAVTADIGNGGVEIVEGDILLRYAASRRRAVRLSDRLPHGGRDRIEEGPQVGLL